MLKYVRMCVVVSTVSAHFAHAYIF